MNISEHGIKLLALWEGLKTHIYLDAVKLPTIGVGHLLTKKELDCKVIIINNVCIDIAKEITKEQALQLFYQDLQGFVKNVNNKVTVKLNQNQFDTLVSFSFNIGVTAFNNSTLLKKLNNGEYKEVSTQLKRWNKAQGKVIAGLINRRNKEIALWNSVGEYNGK